MFKTQENENIIHICLESTTLDILRFALTKLYNNVNKNDNILIELKVLYKFIEFLNEISFNELGTTKN